MDAARLKVFRGLLEERLRALETRAGETLNQFTDQRESLSDQADIATEESDRELSLRMHDHDRVVVQEIRAAMKRIDDGEYGECQACGEEIGERRLMARPMATHCIDCMTELETSARAF